jgi:4-hydroxyproline epimerase
MHTIDFIDSHTAGEPTRVIVRGGPDLGSGPLSERAAILRNDHDRYRSAMVNEPRGSDVLVGALLVEPVDPASAAAVVFFNNVSTLGMCGHGTIGLVKTLEYLGRLGPGTHRIETPVGTVETQLHSDGTVSVVNVPAFRTATAVTVNVVGLGDFMGDVAWGGNWFFLVENAPFVLSPGNVDELTYVTWRLRQAVNLQGFPEVDHIEFFGPPGTSEARSRNFVLCPGKAYDRSPCGTGTSAKLACLAEDGKLLEGETWVQESILGTTFRGSYRRVADQPGIVIPTIRGAAFITARGTLLLDDNDPFCWGIRS